MLNIGCHLSTTKGFKNMGKEALSIGANTFQFFTRNPRGGKAKDIDEKEHLNKVIVPANLDYAVNSVLPTMTQAEYDALETKDENLFYMIVEE